MPLNDRSSWPTTRWGSIAYGICAIVYGSVLAFAPDDSSVWPHLIGGFLLIWGAVWMCIVLRKRDWPEAN